MEYGWGLGREDVGGRGGGMDGYLSCMFAGYRCKRCIAEIVHAKDRKVGK